MPAKTKIYLRKFLNYAVTVVSCVFIIVLGITFFSRATTVTTTIGENISTNDLIVYGNATTTGSHYIGGSLVASYFTASSTSATSTFPYLTSTQMAITGLTAGSIPFIGTGGIVAQDNSNFYWNDTNNRLGIGTSSPYAMLSVAGQTVAEYFTATSTSATSTIAGSLMITKSPSVAHTFSSWDVDVANSSVLNSALLINPASITADTNMIGVAVNGSVKFLVDSEGDVFVNSLTATGTVTQALTNISTLVVENNTTLGDAISDVMTFKSGDIIYFNKATSTIVNNAVNAWSVATSTSIVPTLTISTASSPFGYVGIGTTSPYTTLSVSGETAANYFTAISTTATTTLSGGLNVGSGAFVYGYSSGNTWIGSGNFGVGTTSPGINNSILTINKNFSSASGRTADIYTYISNTRPTDIFIGLHSNIEESGTMSYDHAIGIAGGANIESGLNTNSTSTVHAIRGKAYGRPTDSSKGVIGISGRAYHTGTTQATTGGAAYGGFFQASGEANYGQMVGVYGEVVSGGAANNKWAGYFTGGNVYASNKLSIATTSNDVSLHVIGGAGEGVLPTIAAFTNFILQNDATSGTLNAMSMIAGTAGANAIQFGDANDENAGQIAYFNSTDSMTFTTNAAQQMVINSSGLVGIGTTSPYAKLSVVGETVSTYFTATSTTATSTFPYLTSTQIAVTGLTAGSIPFVGTGGILSQNNSNLYWDNSKIRLGIGTSSPSSRLTVWGSGSGSNTLANFVNSASSTLLAILENGNIGIGTTSPFTTFSVAGIGSFDDYVRASYFIATSTTATSTFGFNISGASGVNTIISAQAGQSIVLGPYGASVGVGTTTPWGKLSVTNISSGPSFIVEDAVSPDGSPFIIDASGNVSIGTTTSISKLTVQGAGTGLNQTFAVYDNTNSATSTFVVLDNGYVGIGTSTPWGRFSIEQGTNDNDVLIVADAGTSTPFMRINGGGVTTIDQLNTGPMAFDTNAGAVSWVDMQVDTTVATGTIESYTAMIDSNQVLTIFGQVGGGGVLATTSVGIGTTTPSDYFTVDASTTAPVAAFLVRNINTAPEGPIASFWDGGTEVFKIDAAGNIGIGTSTYLSTLTIHTNNAKVEISRGGLCVDTDGGCNASTTGRISAVSYVTAASDLAEDYYSSDNLEAGDIVITKGNDFAGKADKNKQDSIIGVVSSKPGFILGFDNDAPTDYLPPGAIGKYPIALAGRVPVKVNLEGGDIAIGDALAISSENGIAQKANQAGKIIGYALEEFTSEAQTSATTTPQILIFLNITYWFPADSFLSPSANLEPTAENNDGSQNVISQSFEWVIDQFKNIGITIADSIIQAKEFIADKITAKKAVLEEIEMIDKATGETYCVRMENGEMNKVLGECQ